MIEVDKQRDRETNRQIDSLLDRLVDRQIYCIFRFTGSQIGR